MISIVKRLFAENKKTILVALAALAIGIGASALVLSGRTSTTNPSSDEAKRELDQVVSQVGKLMILPNEEPSLVTVVDHDKLKNDRFLSQSANGDKVLIYIKAQRAIIYRPGLNKIVDVGPIAIGKEGSAYITARIAIWNGSGDPEQTTRMVAAVLTSFPNSMIVDKADAPRSFPKTVISDLSGTSGTVREQVADTLGIESGPVPTGVNTPQADLLIIVGQDRAGK